MGPVFLDLIFSHIWKWGCIFFTLMWSLECLLYTHDTFLGPIDGGWKKSLLFGGSKIRIKFGTANVYTVCKKWGFDKNEQLCEKYVLSTLFYKSNMIHNLKFKN